MPTLFASNTLPQPPLKCYNFALLLTGTETLCKIWSILLLFLFLALTVACSGGDGVSSPSGVSGTTYEGQVANFKAGYGKSDEWEDWMIANKARYEATFFASSAKPATITISFRYETAPINYNPAWIDEAEHMNVFAAMAEGAYSGYNFNIVFEGNTSTSYANIIAGIATNTSYSSGKNDLYYETIFNHEFGHTMNLPHHYDSTGEIGDGKHMPPGRPNASWIGTQRRSVQPARRPWVFH